MTSHAPPLPVTVLGGYLGAGKTSLLNHLLRHAGGLRLTVLVNDFGTVGIDADLIESREADVMNLAGGCVCCSFGSDLVQALQSARGQIPAPDRILIETSGVALPAAVAGAVSLVGGLHVDSIAVMVDATAIRHQANDKYVGGTVCQQLRQADLLVLNKQDLLAPAALGPLRLWLAQQAPATPVADAVHGAVAVQVLLHPPYPRQGSRARRWPARAGAPAAFCSLSFTLAHGVDVAGLARALQDPACGVVRAKGLLRDRDGVLQLLQLAGLRCTTVPWRGRAAAAGRLVCIGPAATWNAHTLQARVRQYADAHGAAAAPLLEEES